MNGPISRKALATVRSPKLRGRSPWYPYYAAFDSAFVDDLIESLDPSSPRLLDPWNGSGTTTHRGHLAGLETYGFDLNPACVVVAKARLLPRGLTPSLLPLSNDLLSHAREAFETIHLADEPLRAWFTDATAHRLRRLETAIRMKLADPEPGIPIAEYVDQISSLSAFYYVALFAVVRELTAGFRSTNPTWVKRQGIRMDANWQQLSGHFRRAVRSFASRCEAAPQISRPSTLAVGNATGLPLEAKSVGAVLTSPPYATRIDYVVATRPELAVLRLAQTSEPQLRRLMLGTTAMSDSHAQPATISEDLGSGTASAFLEQVRGHPSKASGTYYARYFEQYFAGLRDAIREIDRVAEPGAPIAMVVQDSYYKEVRLDLPQVVAEMLAETGRSDLETRSFDVGTRAAINPDARNYRSNFGATEAVVVARQT